VISQEIPDRPDPGSGSGFVFLGLGPDGRPSGWYYGRRCYLRRHASRRSSGPRTCRSGTVPAV
jgi:hypothetical protein